MTMSGSVTGESRAQLIEKAEAIAAAYYGTTCVSVRLRNEGSESMKIARTADGSIAYERFEFVADFDAAEHHTLSTANHGPDKCMRCERESWPHSPLPQGRRWSE